jgi:hypothetical protein
MANQGDLSSDHVQIPTKGEYQEQNAQEARAGDIEAAREILEVFTREVGKYNEQTWSADVPWPYVRYVADALRKVLELEPDRAAVALGIKNARPGRPKGNKGYEPVALAAAYFLLVRAGNVPKAAKSLIKETLGASDDVLGDAVAMYARLADQGQFDDDLLRAMLGGYGGKIAVIFPGRDLRSQ